MCDWLPVLLCKEVILHLSVWGHNELPISTTFSFELGRAWLGASERLRLEFNNCSNQKPLDTKEDPKTVRLRKIRTPCGQPLCVTVCPYLFVRKISLNLMVWGPLQGKELMCPDLLALSLPDFFVKLLAQVVRRLRLARARQDQESKTTNFGVFFDFFEGKCHN